MTPESLAVTIREAVALLSTSEKNKDINTFVLDDVIAECIDNAFQFEENVLWSDDEVTSNEIFNRYNYNMDLLKEFKRERMIAAAMKHSTRVEMLMTKI